jgi:hypothetical protein
MLSRSAIGTFLLVMITSAATVFADAKEDVAAAVKKLAESDSYSWTTASGGAQGVVAGGAEGKTRRDGLTMLNLGLRDVNTQILFKDGKGAYRSPDSEWKSIAADGGGAGGAGAGGATTQGANSDARMIANMIKTYRPPAAQAQNIFEQAQDLKKSDDGSFTGSLPPDQAKALILRRIVRGAGGADMTVKDPTGGVKFWTSDDGVLRRFEFHVEGTLSVNGEDRPINRTTTVEMKDVGKTTIDVPEDAKAKMGGG